MNDNSDTNVIMRNTKFLLFLFVGVLVILFIPLKLSNAKLTTPFQDPIPDYIFYNGTVITMDGLQPTAEAVAVKDNIIITVGSVNDVFLYADSETEIINLKGKTLTPGFIDSHGHWIGDRGLTNTTELNEVIDTLISKGWTSINELFVDQNRLNELQTIDNAGLLKVRVNCYLPLGYAWDRFGDWYQAYTPGYEYSSRLRIAGVKMYADHWYRNESVFNFINQSEMNQLVQEAHSWGFQIATHSVIPNATDIVLNAYESVIGTGSNDLRHRIEHLVLLRDDQITRIADLGVYASVQLPWFNSDWNDRIPDSLAEPEWLELVGRWRDLLDAGAHLIGSTDWPYGQLYKEINTPSGLIAVAATRIGNLGETPAEYMLNQTITAEQAMQSLTIDAAYGTFQEGIKGSIAFGKLADLVVLSDNPLTVPVTEIKDLKVLLTMIDGEILYIRPEDDGTTTITPSSSVPSSALPSSSITDVPLLPLIIAFGLLLCLKRIYSKT